jgi:hypothetical protein
VAVPSPATWAAASIVTDAQLNLEIRDSLNFLLAPPRVYAYHTAGTTLTNGVWTLISLGGELYDPYSVTGHDTVTNNSRVFARETGIYAIDCQVSSSNTLGNTAFQLQIRQNAAGNVASGTRVLLQTQNAAGGGLVTSIGRSTKFPLTSGDYVELFAYFDTGGTAGTLATGADRTYLDIQWSAKT